MCKPSLSQLDILLWCHNYYGFLTSVPTSCSHIQTANGECVRVDSVGLVVFLSIHLKNCLLILSLSHKLLSINQMTKELNCTILISSSGCIVHDAQIGTVIGHGTE